MHVVDYIAIGFLIASMLLAAAKIARFQAEATRFDDCLCKNSPYQLGDIPPRARRQLSSNFREIKRELVKRHA